MVRVVLRNKTKCKGCSSLRRKKSCDFITPFPSVEREMEGDTVEMEVDEETLPKCLSSYVDQGSTESHRYYLSRRTIHEMLKDRGYSILDSEINLTLDEFRNKYGQNLNIDSLGISATLRSNPSKKVQVVFCGSGIIKVNAMRSILMPLANIGLSRLIIVVQNKVTKPAMNELEKYRFKVEIFEITDLLVNITKHVLKPKHRLLTDAEKKKLLKKFNLEEKQLPRMTLDDAIAQYYGWQKGQIVEISYNGEATGLHVTYRCVW